MITMLIGRPLVGHLGRAVLLAGAVMSAACQSNASQRSSGTPPTFRQAVDRVMPHMGKGNMIVIADAAFPKTSHAGWTSVPMSMDPIKALKDVLDSSSAFGHVKARVYVDRELMALTDQQAPGVSAFRQALASTLGDVPLDSSITESDLRSQLREVSETCRVIVIKTPNRLPYSTIYVEFDHGVWTPEQEAQLRQQMAR